LGRFVEGAGLVMIVSAVFMIVVQIRARAGAQNQDQETS